MELLAPAGTMENFIAALEAGADAIYLGGKVFNARSHAGNFEYEELTTAVKMAHILDVSIFVTVNIIVGDKEMEALKKHLLELVKIGVDGIIVQDLGVAQIAKEIAPTLELHASTQLTATNLGTVQFLERMGFTRIVLSRELSLDEIRYICANTKAEIEVFIHGALCISYSGQCLMSSFIGGRSGNRGSCAQSCRLPYDLITIDGEKITKENETYIMSPKDLNYSEYMGELIRAGVTSFKVEGRMKKASYVKEVIGTYRRIIDRAGHIKKEDIVSLQQGFNRGFSTAYLEDKGRKEMMTIVAPNNQGKKIGKTSCKGKNLLSNTSELLEQGDLLKVISPLGEVGYFTVDERWKQVSDNLWNAYVEEPLEGTLYLAKSKKDKKHRGIKDLQRKVAIYAYLDGVEGEKPTLTLVDDQGRTISVTNDYIVAKAMKKPTSFEAVKEQLGRLGNTLFELAHLEMPSEDFMWPSSVLNQLRREAIEQLESLYLSEYANNWSKRRLTIDRLISNDVKKRGAYAFTKRSKAHSSEISAQVDTLEGVTSAIASGATRIIFGGDRLHRTPLAPQTYREVVDLCKKNQVYISLGLPRIVRAKEEEAFKQLLSTMVVANPDGFHVHFLGALEWLTDLGYTGHIHGDTSLQLFNSEFGKLLQELGFSSVTASQEATLEQIHRLVENLQVDIECVVQGFTEVMITEYCPISSFGGTGEKANCPAPCIKKQYALRDRKGEVFPLRTDEFCRVHVLNSRELEMRSYALDIQNRGVAYLRIDGREQSNEWIRERITDYIGILNGTIKPPSKDSIPSITRGHFFKGIIN